MFAKIGNVRINLDNVTQVQERLSNFIVTYDNGQLGENYYAKAGETKTDIVVTVSFISTSETPDYVKLFGDEGRKFLDLIDHLAIN